MPSTPQLGKRAESNEHGQHGQVERYHDDPADDLETLDPDTDTFPRSLERPSEEFDGLLRRTNFTWKDRIAARVTPGIRRGWDATVEWVHGPKPPRIFHITPLLPQLQHAPIALIDRLAPTKARRFWLLVLAYACWLFAFSIVMWQSSFTSEIPGYGAPTRISCAVRYFQDKNLCGLNGDQCRPFSNATFAFRCPADCHKIEVLNPHAVGDQEINYQPLAVGGHTDRTTGFENELVDNAIYRGDSFICASAVHAGFIDDSQGGCGVLKLTGEQPSFPSSKRNGIPGVEFDSYFPHSFGFLSGTRSPCKDLRWPALVISVIFSALISVFTTSPAVFFWTNFVGLFFHVGLASDPPNLTNYYSLISIAFGRFLPACFCGWVTYRYTVKRSLTDLTAQFEKTILWLGPCWVGALNNYTFDRIPIQRLTPHDIQAQPGAVPALIIIVLTILSIALGQAWALRVEGRMPRYLVIYGLMVAGLLIMLAMPGLNLRIHHYILGLLFLPGTSMQNRPSLVYQGLLTGLFINGIARWGFDSILQTPGELLEGAAEGTLLPAISVLAITARNITFNLGSLPVYDPKTKVSYDGVSVLVNDVERFRGYGDNSDYWSDDWAEGSNYTWTWNRHQVRDDEVVDEAADGVKEEIDTIMGVLPEYFRFGYMVGSRVGDFTKAGKWDIDGNWTDMKPGPS